jgi:hypothetical protein
LTAIQYGSPIPAVADHLLSATASVFGPSWYDSVGVALPAWCIAHTLLSMCASPALCLCCARRRRRRAVRTASSQAAVDRRLAPPPFRHEGVLAGVVATVGVCVTWCCALPVLLPLALVYLVVRYWMDKVGAHQPFL